MNSGAISFHARLRTFAFATGFAAMFVSTAVFLGWAANIPWLTSLSSRFVTMKPITVLCFLFSGISLSLLAPTPAMTEARSRLAQAFAVLVVLVGIATTIEFVGTTDLHFEDLLFRHALYATRILYPGRMSIATAIAFILLGIALALLDLEIFPGIRPSQFLCVCVVLFSLVNFLGYLYGVDGLYRALCQNPMAVHTAVLLFLLALGAIFARPERGIVAVFSGPGVAGHMARRVLPAASILIVIIGWVRLLGERHGLYGTSFGLAIFATANITTFAILLGLAARSLNTSFERLDVASHDLAVANERAKRANFRLAAIIDSSDDAIISNSLDGTITS
jgi:hypothetical protein